MELASRRAGATRGQPSRLRGHSDHLMLALARKTVAAEEHPGSVEAVFAQAQRVAAEAEALLDWHAPEPELMAAGAGRATEATATG